MELDRKRSMEGLLREKRERQERQDKEIAEGRGPELLPGVKPVILRNKNGW